jgi:hypothetical protein
VERGLPAPDAARKVGEVQENRRRFRDRLLSSTDALGKLATIPVVVQFVNAANRNGLARRAMEGAIGVHRDRVLPEYAQSGTFRSGARPAAAFAPKEGKNTPGKGRPVRHLLRELQRAGHRATTC